MWDIMEYAIYGLKGHEPRWTIQDYNLVKYVDFVSLEAATT